MDTQVWQDKIDDLTIEALRAQGGAKWSRFPNHIGSFIAEMDFGVHPTISAVLCDHIKQGHTGYATAPWPQDMAGAYALFAEHRYQVSLNPDWILPISDVLCALESVLESFVSPTAPVVVITPAYMGFFGILNQLGRTIIEVPLREDEHWAMDYDAIDTAMGKGAKLVVLCHPHNPSGRVYTQTELLTLAEVVDSHDGLVFSDEIHAPLTYPGFTYLPYGTLNERTRAHTVTATSASKAWNIPGLRCAQLIVHNETHYRHYVTGPGYRHMDRVPNLGLFANTCAYTQAADWLDLVLPYLSRNLDLLDEMVGAGAFDGVEMGQHYQRPEGTFLVWMDMGDTKIQSNPHALLAEQALVYATDGAHCGHGFESFIRLNCATPFPIWQETLERISTVCSA